MRCFSLTESSHFWLESSQVHVSGSVLDGLQLYFQVCFARIELEVDDLSKIGTISTEPFKNLLFGLCYGLCAYFYFCSMLYDPGYVPKLAGLTQQKAVIDELLDSWRFDDENFCVQCMVRRPLRSKHCKKCGRCVAKHDQ